MFPTSFVDKNIDRKLNSYLDACEIHIRKVGGGELEQKNNAPHFNKLCLKYRMLTATL